MTKFFRPKPRHTKKLAPILRAKPKKRWFARFIAGLLMRWWETCPRCLRGFGGHERGVGRNVKYMVHGKRKAYGLVCPTCAKEAIPKGPG